MKTKSELLKLVKDEYLNGKFQKEKIIGTRGICNAIYSLNIRALISKEEMNSMFGYLELHGLNRGDYYWERRDVQSRLEWLDEHIKLTEKDERIQK